MTIHASPGALPVWQSSLIASLPSSRHGFTGRPGGVSEGAFASLNLGSRTQDIREHVMENRARAAAAVGKTGANFIALKQVHSPTVVQVTAQAGPHIEADAMWTKDRDCVLAVLGADCLPLVVADKRGRAVGAAHAGWRGTQARIATRLVERLIEQGLSASDLLVALGPCIGPCCFEIGEEVASELVASFGAPRQAVIRKDGQKPHADLWQLNAWALEDAGVPPEQIEVVRRCTRCEADLFSYRGDAGVTGRQAGLIALT